MEKKQKLPRSEPKAKKAPTKTSGTKLKKNKEEKKPSGKGEFNFPMLGIGVSAGVLEVLRRELVHTKKLSGPR
jgi:hypothetical protein